MAGDLVPMGPYPSTKSTNPSGVLVFWKPLKVEAPKKKINLFPTEIFYWVSGGKSTVHVFLSPNYGMLFINTNLRRLEQKSKSKKTSAFFPLHQRLMCAKPSFPSLAQKNPCRVYIYPHEWLIFMVNVGENIPFVPWIVVSVGHPQQSRKPASQWKNLRNCVNVRPEGRKTG